MDRNKKSVVMLVVNPTELINEQTMRQLYDKEEQSTSRNFINSGLDNGIMVSFV